MCMRLYCPVGKDILAPAWPPAWASVAGVATALLTGIIASLLPAARAARLDPVLALGGK